MKYVYIVPYYFETVKVTVDETVKTAGLGRMELGFPHKVTCIEDLETMEKVIMKLHSKYEKVFVFSPMLLRLEKEETE